MLDNVLNSIAEIVEYNWAEEMRDFCETYQVEVQSQDHYYDWIRTCEKHCWTSHIFYHLMKVKQEVAFELKMKAQREGGDHD